MLDKANEINLNPNIKPIKSSQTLQIIQSRLAYKQQLYTEVLLKKDLNNANADTEEIETKATNFGEPSTAKSLSSPVGSLNRRYGYLSDEDNESFVSADSVREFHKKPCKNKFKFNFAAKN